MRKKTTILPLLLLPVVLTFCHTTRLVNPDPIPLAADAQASRAAIVAGMRAQSWALTQEEPGRIHAMRVVNGKHEMQVLLAYDKESVRIEYEGSKKLRYSKGLFGTEFIHQKYIEWTANLRWEIVQQLSHQRTAEGG